MKEPVGRETGERIEYLDSLRGAAAMAVVVFHSLIVHPAFYYGTDHPLVAFLRTWPVRLLWGGHEAVSFFFLLSGFVLALSFLKPRQPGYARFALRRVIRLYPPYLGAYVITVLLFLASSSYGIGGLAETFNNYWNRPLTVSAALGHALMLTHSNFINGAAWSLVDEMRVSLVFPLLFIACTRLGFLVSVILFVVAGIAAGHAAATLTTTTISHHIASSLLGTLAQVPLFVMGIAIAANRARLVSVARGLPAVARVGLTIGGLWLVGQIWATVVGISIGIPVVGLGFAVLLLLVMSSPRLQQACEHPALLWIGQRSYSLYLIHSGVMYFLFYALQRVLPLWAISILVLPCALLAADLVFRACEAPSIAASRRASTWFSRSRLAERDVVRT
jgi:peptidoglycan/LPS O-acetylase OafA/YrhL